MRETDRQTDRPTGTETDRQTDFMDYTILSTSSSLTTEQDQFLHHNSLVRFLNKIRNGE